MVILETLGNVYIPRPRYSMGMALIHLRAASRDGPVHLRSTALREIRSSSFRYYEIAGKVSEIRWESQSIQLIRI